MATYTIKLVDHADYTEQQKNAICIAVKEVFNRAFDGDPNRVNVLWGTSDLSDNLVIHFVSDIGHSYIRQKWPTAKINPDAGGHTHSDASLSGTEIYRTRRGKQFHPKELAVTVFHESMHNLYPFQPAEFVHNLDGGGDAAGLAAAHYNVNTEMTQHNKELIRKGFATKNNQLL